MKRTSYESKKTKALLKTRWENKGKRPKTVVSLFIVSFIYISIALTSCSTSNSECEFDRVYTEVLSKKVEYENMPRSKWLELPDSLKRAVYTVMKPEVKYNFWIEKMDETEKLEWTSDERAHVNLLREFIVKHPLLFEKGFLLDEKHLEEFNSFIDEWRIVSKEKFSWSNSMQYCIAAYGDVITDKMFKELKDGATFNGVGNYCECSSYSDWCFSGTCNDKERCSTDAVDGCGTFWLFRCNGKCNKKN